MATVKVHKEDVKAELRKRYGSLDAAQSAMGFTGWKLRDLLRGRMSKRVHAAVARELGVNPDHLVITTGVIQKSGAKNRQDERARA